MNEAEKNTALSHVFQEVFGSILGLNVLSKIDGKIKNKRYS